MNKLTLILSSVALLLLASCGQNSKTDNRAVSNDTLAYSIQSIKEKAGDCVNKPDSGCTMAIYTFPVFKSDKSLNDTVTATLVNFFNTNTNPDSSLHQTAKLFITAYNGYKKAYPKKAVKFSLNCESKVLYHPAGLTIVGADFFITMTAAGGHITRFINWDNAAEKKLTMEDLFIPDYQKKLNAIGESIFRKNEGLSDTEPLTKYFFPNKQFKLNDNFCITPEGLAFIYLQNEIKPMAAGQTRIVIPYNDIRSILKPNTALWQFIK